MIKKKKLKNKKCRPIGRQEVHTLYRITLCNYINFMPASSNWKDGRFTQVLPSRTVQSAFADLHPLYVGSKPSVGENPTAGSQFRQ